MIVTLTMNPAVDYLLWPRTLTPGATNRAVKDELHFGGKGLNVSALLTALGVPNKALGVIAGFTGEALAQDTARRGIKADWVRLPAGHTRINVKIEGERETEASLAELKEELAGLQRGDTLVFSGSLPAGAPPTLYAELTAGLPQKGVAFAVDAAGAVLLRTLPGRPALIKPNRAELEELVGRPLPGEADLRAAASELQQMGARNVLVSLGGEGALLLDETGGYHRRAAARGEVVSTVGAGDSMLAGFLAGAEQGYDYALRLAVAAGCATAFSHGLATKEAVLALANSL